VLLDESLDLQVLAIHVAVMPFLRGIELEDLPVVGVGEGASDYMYILVNEYNT
jgi:hypothetical protein